MTNNRKPREFDKVDRALEIKVIDWLQWSEFPENIGKSPDDSDMAQLTLTLLSKRKSAYKEIQKDLEFHKHKHELMKKMNLELRGKLKETIEFKDSIINNLTKENMSLSDDLRVAVEALEDVFFNTAPERKATYETRLKIIRIDSGEALKQIRGES